MADLYANETVRVWDIETETVELPEEVKAEVEKLIEDGRALEALKTHSGWKILADYLDLRITDYKEKLTTEKEFSNVRRYQESVKAYSDILGFMEYKILEAKTLVEKQSGHNDR